MNDYLIPTIICDGLLFVGDPHITGRKPGRRKDKDFGDTVLRKIEEIVDIANERNLLIVFLGDMFDRPYEEDESLKVRCIRAFRRAKHKPVGIDGNHDKKSSLLTDRDTLKILIEGGHIDIATSARALVRAKIGDLEVGLGGSPHGFEIPEDAGERFPGASGVVWLTHEDMAFEGAYPGAKDLYEVPGVSLVVNGHMHLTKKPRTVGSTMWFNPGNITRMAVDAKDHVPAVWQFDPVGGIQQIELTHQKDIFDLTGRLIDSVSPGEVASVPMEGEPESAFVEMLRAERSTDIEQTMDGSALLEEVQAVFAAEDTPDDVRALILQLHQQAVKAA